MLRPLWCPALLCLLLVPPAVQAQSLNAAQVLERSAQAYKALNTYRDRVSVRMEATLKGENGKPEKNSTQFTASTLFQRPNKLRLEVESSEWPASLVVDGSRRIYYVENLKEYVTAPAPELKEVLREGIAQFLLGPVLMAGLLDELAGLHGERAFMDAAGEAKLDGRAKVGGRECYVVEIERQVRGLPLLPGVVATPVPYRYFIDTEDFLARRVTIDFAPILKQTAKTMPGQVPSALTASAEVERLQANPSLSASDFTFTAPQDAKEVRQFSDRRLVIVQPREEMVGKPAPNVEFVDLFGKPLKLADLKGKVVLLQFWATWCRPCAEEIPVFVKLYEKYKDQGLVVVGASIYDYGLETLGPWTVRAKMTYPVVIATANERDRFGRFNDLPTNFLIDRQGIIRYQFNGKPSDLGVYEEKVAELLAAKPPAPPPSG